MLFPQLGQHVVCAMRNSQNLRIRPVTHARQTDTDNAHHSRPRESGSKNGCFRSEGSGKYDEMLFGQDIRNMDCGLGISNGKTRQAMI